MRLSSHTKHESLTSKQPIAAECLHIKVTSVIEPKTEVSLQAQSHSENGTEASLVCHHVFESLVSLGQRESLAHALDVESVGEGDSILRIECMTRGPAVNRNTLGDHGKRADRHISDGC